MADVQLTVADVRGLADKIAIEVNEMKRQSDRQFRVYIVVGILLTLYLAWAFHKIAVFVEPTRLADSAGDIVVGQAKDIIGKMGDTGAAKAPELVAEAEDAVVRSVPTFREQLETTMRTTIAKLVQETLDGTDQVMIEELGKLPDAEKLVAAAQKNPADAAKLYAEVEKRVLARSDVKGNIADAMAELNKLRDHLRTLREARSLTPSERAERRLLQVVLAKVPLPQEPLTAPAPAASTGLKKK